MPDVFAPLAASLGLDLRALGAVLHATDIHGSTLEEELVLGGHVQEDRLYGTMAAIAGVTFETFIRPDLIEDRDPIDVQLKTPNLLRLVQEGTPSRVALAPKLAEFQKLCDTLRANADQRRRTVITTPSAIRRAVWDAGAGRRVLAAVRGLDNDRPDYSARRTLAAWQAFILGIGLTLLGWLAWLRPLQTLQVIHELLILVYSLAIGLRWLGLFHIRPSIPQPLPVAEEPLPVYSVLVALHREAAVLDQLLDSLLALDWPTSRLDIKLVCEADDAETLGALCQRSLPPHVEIVHVPNHPPRTKPKALTYALAGVRGEFVTIYDAEDRPDPGQLREAYALFRQDGARLACLQAPLQIDNGRESWIAELFAAEYFAQFHGYLVMTARYGWPMPLGGTSNHFRMKALQDVGGWDPYNVTEDADLGLRLARLGFRVGLLHRPTLENAPTAKRIWINQRSRWLKGWLQTFLVGFRQPRTLAREIGLSGLVVSALNSAGAVLSGLLYPLFFVSLGLIAYWGWQDKLPPFSSLTGLLMIADGMNMLAGYAYYLTAAVLFHRRDGRPFSARHAVLIPYLWLLLTVAAWKALYQLVAAPHSWNKTPHSPATPVQRDAQGTLQK